MLFAEDGIVYFCVHFVLVVVTILSNEDSLGNKVVINFISILEVCCHCVGGPYCIIII